MIYETLYSIFQEDFLLLLFIGLIRVWLAHINGKW